MGSLILLGLIIVGILFLKYSILNSSTKRKPIKYKLLQNELENALNKDFEQFDKKLNDDFQILRQNNEAWSKEHSEVMYHQNLGFKLEKSDDKYGAIDEYSKAFMLGLSSKRLQFNNYATSACRMIILYRKTKQKEKEIGLLKRLLELEPYDRNSNHWRERLAKLDKTII